MGTSEVTPAPATFRVHRSRLWLGMASILLPTMLVLQASSLTIRVAMGRTFGASDLVETVAIAVLGALGGATGALLGMGRSPGWVRASEAGLEFAGSRRAPMFLPWSAIRSVRRRFAGPLTQLVITPTTLDAVSVAPGRLRAQKAWRRRGASSFVVEAGMMTPGPTELLTELDRRLAAHS